MFNHSKSLAKAFDKAEGFIVVEEAMSSLKQNMPEKPKDKEKSNNNKSEGYQKKYNNNNGGSVGGRPPFLNQRVNKIYTKLNTDWATILEHMKDKPYFEPAKDNKKLNKGNANKFYDYHGSAGHFIETYWGLMDLIEKNVKSGALV